MNPAHFETLSKLAEAFETPFHLRDYWQTCVTTGGICYALQTLLRDPGNATEHEWCQINSVRISIARSEGILGSPYFVRTGYYWPTRFDRDDEERIEKCDSLRAEFLRKMIVKLKQMF